MRKIRFLSVSALSMFENQPNKFFMCRLADKLLPRDPQNLAAAAGTAFDIEIKKELAKGLNLGSKVKNRFCTLPWPQPHNKYRTLNDLFLDSIEVQNRIPEIMEIGKKLFHIYIKSDLYHRTTFCDIECRSLFNLKVKVSGQEKCVPLYAILDAIANSNYPLDFKVAGYGSGASPKQNYFCAYDEMGIPYKRDKWIKNKDISFQDIDESWATQGCVYGWSIGKKLFVPFPFEVHAIFIGKPKKDGTRSIIICGYHGIITEEFQKMVALRLLKAWAIINTGGDDTPWAKEELFCEMMAYQERWF